jgi:hypothetical protein
VSSNLCCRQGQSALAGTPISPARHSEVAISEIKVPRSRRRNRFSEVSMSPPKDGGCSLSSSTLEILPLDFPTVGRCGSVASTTESSTGRTGGLSRAAVRPLGTFGTARRARYTVTGYDEPFLFVTVLCQDPCSISGPSSAQAKLGSRKPANTFTAWTTMGLCCRRFHRESGLASTRKRSVLVCVIRPTLCRRYWRSWPQ